MTRPDAGVDVPAAVRVKRQTLEKVLTQLRSQSPEIVSENSYSVPKFQQMDIAMCYFNQERLDSQYNNVYFDKRTEVLWMFTVFVILDPCEMSSGLEGGGAEHRTGIPPRGLDTGGGSSVNRLFGWPIFMSIVLLDFAKCDILCPQPSQE